MEKNKLTRNEVNAVLSLKLVISAESELAEHSTILALFSQLVLEKIQTMNEKLGLSYSDLLFIVPTSDTNFKRV